MSFESVEVFNRKVAESPGLQAQLRAAQSPLDVVRLAKAEGLDLTGEDLQTLAQQAYQTWIEGLEPNLASFFSQVHTTKALDEQLRQCQSSADVIALAHTCDIALTEADLRQAAMVAESVPGFSFEKLWFRGLGLK